MFILIFRERLRCSLFRKATKGGEKAKQGIQFQCLVYLHSHLGNRKEGEPLVQLAAQTHDVCLIDFVGSGCSEGEYSTFGIREAEDAEVLLSVLEKYFGYTQFCLWGKGSGAAAIFRLFARNNASVKDKIQGIILDEPFSFVNSFVGFDYQAYQRTLQE